MWTWRAADGVKRKLTAADAVSCESSVKKRCHDDTTTA